MASHALADTELPDLLLRLGRDHGRIAAMNNRLAEVADRLSGLEAGEAPVDGVDSEALWAEALDALHFQQHFAERIHHPLEDRLFESLLLKGLTPTERHLAFRNLGQHQELMTMTEQLLQQAGEGAAAALADVPAFVELLTEYLLLQRRHMTFEETHMFPLLMSRLENDDWNRLDDTLAAQFPIEELESH